MFNIVLCMDENNIDGLFTVINSIVKTTNDIKNIKFSILTYDNKEFLNKKLLEYFGDNIVYRLEQFIDYSDYQKFLEENISVAGSEKKFKYIANIMNFSRFYIPLIFKDIDIGLYLDTDVIIQTDIIKIFDTVVQPLIIASPLNKPIETMEIDKQFNMTGYGFNTGVYMLNFVYWRENDLTIKCEELMLRHKSIPLFKLGTQPIINILFYEKCINIDKRWNFTGLGTNEYSLEKLERQYILHWTGPKKPWLSDGLNKNAWEKYSCRI